MKRTKNKSNSCSRRQFIGNCIAGVSLIHLTPYLSMTGCTSTDRKHPPVTNRKYYPLKFQEDELVKLKEGAAPLLVTENGDGIKMNIIFPGFYSFDKYAFIDAEQHERKKFQYISINKVGWSNYSGKPEIPFFGFLMHIPQFLDFEWIANLPSGEDIKTYTNMVVYPSQVRYFDNIENPDNYGLFEYDRIYYNLNIFPDPDKVVEISEPFNIGFSRFILIKVRPLLFNPGEECVFGYPEVTINFKFKVKTTMEDSYYLETPFLPPHLEYIQEHERIIDPWKDKNEDGSRDIDLIQSIVAGFNPDINKEYVKDGYELLVIYGEDLKNKISLAGPAKRLLEHKTRTMHLTAKMISYSSLLSTTDTEELSMSIRNYRQPDFSGNTIYFPGLRDVILLGDLNVIPCKFTGRVLFEEDDQNVQSQAVPVVTDNTGQNRYEKKFYTDYYCNALKEAENRKEIIIPDISIGRIPVKNEKEAYHVIDNIIHYETTAYKVRQNLTMAGYFQDTGKDGYECNGVASTDYLQTLEEIRSKLLVQSVSIQTIYDIQDPSLIDQGLWYRNGEQVENPELMFTDKNDLKNKILDNFKSGNRIILHRNHGNMNGWSRPSFKIPDLWALFEPGEEEIPSSIVFSMNCLSGHFTGEKTTRMPQKYYDCFAEVLIKGPVLPDGIRKNLKFPAVFAADEESPSMHNDWLIRAIFDGMYGSILSGNKRDLTEKRKLGDVINLGKALLFTCMDDPCLNMYENEIYHLLGDPTILI